MGGALLVLVMITSELLTSRPHREWHYHSQGWQDQERAVEDGEGHAMLRPILLFKEMLLNQARETVSIFLLKERKFSRNPGVLRQLCCLSNNSFLFPKA